MKKVLSVLGLIAILGLTTPAMAAPPHHGGPHGGHRVHAGAHHRPSMHRPPHHGGGYYRHHGGITFHTGYPRHSHWGCRRTCYWGDPWCNNRLGYYYAPYYMPMSGASFSIRF